MPVSVSTPQHALRVNRAASSPRPGHSRGDRLPRFQPAALMETMEIRPAVAADVAAMLAFVHELAIYEREPDAVKMTAGQLDAALFAEPAHLFAHVAVDDAVVVGMAIWFLIMSSCLCRNSVSHAE